MQHFVSDRPFALENGSTLPGIRIGYHTWGTLNADASNVVWICHALTASSDAADWWPGMIGEGCTIDPARHFIVCANILGSCYGSTGPMEENPATGEPYYHAFPQITVRDMVQAHILLRQHLGISSIYLLMGGSMGGYQALEWSILEKENIRNLFLIATSAHESAWGIAIHTAQRLAIAADQTWQENSATAGAAGLKAARAIGMLTYRHYEAFVRQQTDEDASKLDHFKASSYIDYQGQKLVNRFNAYSYWILGKAMDSHNISRGRGGDVAATLQIITQPTLIMAVDSDQLCPLSKQQFMAAHMPNASFEVISSAFGHDGFLVEAPAISIALRNWLHTYPLPS